MASGGGNGVTHPDDEVVMGVNHTSKMWKTGQFMIKLIVAVVLGTAFVVGVYYSFLGKVQANETKIAAVVKDAADNKLEIKAIKELAQAHDRAITQLQSQAKTDEEVKKLMSALITELKKR